MARVAFAVLPAASRAVTMILFKPACKVTLVMNQFAVPLALPLAPRSLLQVTSLTSSEAEPARCKIPLVVEKAAAEVGVVIAMAGFGWSGRAEVTIKGQLAVLPAASRANTVRLFWPGSRRILATDQ